MKEYRVNFENITKKMQKVFNQQKKNLTENIDVNSKISVKKNEVISFVRKTVIDISTYEDLMEEIAELSYRNPKAMLFFRGQKKDYRIKTRFNLKPSIFRTDKKGEELKKVINDRYQDLKFCSNILVEKIINYDFNHNEKLTDGEKEEIYYIEELQQSILQHYEVCPTPFLDVTQSIRVACTFATLDNEEEYSFVFVFALPYISGRISDNSEEYIKNVRLTGIGTTYAKRPFYQEGFLIQAKYVKIDNVQLDKLDFNRRLIAAYRFKNDDSFWGSEKKIEKKNLYPEKDIMKEICEEVKYELNNKNKTKCS